MAFFSQAWAIVRKDLLTELRGASTIVSMVLLGLLVVLVFNFGTEPGTRQRGPGPLGRAVGCLPLLGSDRGGTLVRLGEGGRMSRRTPALPGGQRSHLPGQAPRQPDPGVRHRRGDPPLLHRRLQRGDRGGLARTSAALGAGQRGSLDAGDALRRGRGRGEGPRCFADRVHLSPARAAGHRRCALLHPTAGREEPWRGGLWPWLLVVYDVVFLAVSFMVFDFVVED